MLKDTLIAIIENSNIPEEHKWYIFTAIGELEIINKTKAIDYDMLYKIYCEIKNTGKIPEIKEFKL